MKKFILHLLLAFFIVMLSTGLCWAKPGQGQGHEIKNKGKPGISSVEENEGTLEYFTEEGLKVEIKNGKIEIKNNGSKFKSKKDGRKNKAEFQRNIKEEFKDKLKVYKQIIQQNGNSFGNSFLDVQNHWAEEAINGLSAVNLLNGYEDNTFKPDKPVKQVETISLLMRLISDKESIENEEDENAENNNDQNIESGESIEGELNNSADEEEAESDEEEAENDEDNGSIPGWAQKDINKAAKKGIINMNRFHSHVQTTRALAAVWIAKALGIEPQDVSDITFKDEFLISREYVGYIKALAEEGIILGTPDGKFNPNGAITRAQLAVIMERILTTEQESEDPTTPEESEDQKTEDDALETNNEEATTEENNTAENNTADENNEENLENNTTE